VNASLKSIVAAAVIAVGVLGIVLWRVQTRPPVKITNGVTILDNSGSTQDDREVLIGLAGRALEQRKLTSGSTLTILAVGDSRTGNEPRFIAKYDIPHSRRALEGKAAISRQRTQILTDLQTRLEKLPRTKESPIFLAVKRGIEQLRGSRCVADSECYMFVRTDGEENAEKSIRKALEGKGKPKGVPDPIANDGIRVMFCGLSETSESDGMETNARPAHNARRGDRIQEVWSWLFTARDLVSFEPYCPKSQTEIMQNRGSTSRKD